MATIDRALAVLGLFAREEPEWTVDAAARELKLSQSTAYEYFRSLVNAGLLAPLGSGRYVIGPAVIELDRQTRRHDPLIGAAQLEMDRVAQLHSGGGVALLCRVYRLRVICVDQRTIGAPSFGVSYERGRPMPLIRGSASKIIMAHLSPRALRGVYDENHEQIVDVGLGGDWEQFQARLRELRRAGFCVTHGELDRGLVGISAPIFGSDSEILGSIGLVLPGDAIAPSAEPSRELVRELTRAGREVTTILRRLG